MDFAALPDGCVSTIISLTSPADACRSSMASSTLRSVADSDSVWERFLPSDYCDLASRLLAPVKSSSKKELYFRLRHPILIDGGQKVGLSIGNGFPAVRRKIAPMLFWVFACADDERRRGKRSTITTGSKINGDCSSMWSGSASVVVTRHRDDARGVNCAERGFGGGAL
ncbi:hypothetical protein U1Q18_004279 [Sarracenia purpurea var. burkii]